MSWPVPLLVGFPSKKLLNLFQCSFYEHGTRRGRLKNDYIRVTVGITVCCLHWETEKLVQESIKKWSLQICVLTTRRMGYRAQGRQKCRWTENVNNMAWFRFTLASTTYLALGHKLQFPHNASQQGLNQHRKQNSSFTGSALDRQNKTRPILWGWVHPSSVALYWSEIWFLSFLDIEYWPLVKRHANFYATLADHS